jgi:hypothetical protein
MCKLSLNVVLVDGGEMFDELTLLTECHPIAHWNFAGEEIVGA